MAFNTYNEGIKLASDLAQRAVLAESSLSKLAPLSSPLPTLKKAFTLYISAAESYSHLVTSNLVAEGEKAGIKRKWRLVLERAEKVKARIEEIGGAVGKAEVGDEGEESAITRRGGHMNGLDFPVWRNHSESEFKAGDSPWISVPQPDLAAEQLEQDPEWAEVESSAWSIPRSDGERWVVTQGAGADCSVVAGVGVCLEHNRRRGTKLARSDLFPQSDAGNPKRSENGKHVARLLLNGEWRSVLIDALLPRSKRNRTPLHATSHILDSAEHTPPDSLSGIGQPWIPLALKAYFLAHGGYSLRGSNPAPDIYALTGWIPERISLTEGFQREKEWTKLFDAWKAGDVLITLGSGGSSEALIPLHAYAVLELRTEGDQRILDIYDPGLPAEATNDGLSQALQELGISNDRIRRKTGLFSMTWDEVCGEFAALNLNWSPTVKPVSVKRHWSWPKPSTESTGASTEMSIDPRYRLSVSGATAGDEVWVLLSQHIVSKDRHLDDIAVHIFEEQGRKSSASAQFSVTDSARPYSNAQHILVRHTLRACDSTIVVMPSRDRGFSRTDFTLQAFASAGCTVTLDRSSHSYPFGTTVSGSLSTSSAGGHSGLPSFGSNPQFHLKLGQGGSDSGNVSRASLRLQIAGNGNIPWNVKLLWSNGGLVHDVTQDVVLLESGAYSYGLAFAETVDVEVRSYTVVISTYQPGAVGAFRLTAESVVSVELVPIPSEGAGLYHRTVEGKWTSENAAGRPKLGVYAQNPHVDLILPRPLHIQGRFHHPVIPPSGAFPMNMTLFRRKAGGEVGEQIATSGPYSDAVSGVRITRTKVQQEGVYTLVLSGYERGSGKGSRWRVDVWADGPFSLEHSR